MSMDKGDGYAGIWRMLSEHWLWTEDRPKTYAEAWIDIIWQVQHKTKPQKVRIKNRILICNYGESLKALDTWAKRWQWSKTEVRRFFILLKDDDMIETVSETVTTRLTVCNYKDYDPKMQVRKTVSDTIRNASETHLTPDKKVKKVKNEKKSKGINPVELIPAFEEFVQKFYNEYVMVHYPRSSTNIEGERKAVKILLRRGNEDIDEYYQILKFLQSDSFWRSNIRSIAKLTKKNKDGDMYYFDVILNKSKQLSMRSGRTGLQSKNKVMPKRWRNNG